MSEMAGLDEEQLVAVKLLIESDWDVGKIIQTTEITRGCKDTILYILCTTQEKVVARIYRPFFDYCYTRTHWECKFLEYLEDQKLPVLHYFKTKQNSDVSTVVVHDKVGKSCKL
jgi:hypothetical protein